jgi:Fe2+ or Zn2+ uptake regulation protein
MTAATDTSTEERLITALRAGGHRVTSQRLVLYRVLNELARHATAEAPRLPGLSLPTVYATLDLFAHLGVARRVDGAGSAALYDPRTDDHHHFLCRRCGRILDVEAAVDERRLTAAARAAGAEVDGIEVTLRGLCADCR